MSREPDQSGVGLDARPALARCLAVPTEEFAATYWSARPLLSPAGSLPRDFSDLFSAAAVDELISQRGLRTPFLRMASKGRVLGSSRFTRSGGLGASIDDQVADDKVLAEFSAGATLVLQGLHRTWPPLIDLAQQLATDLVHPVQVNAYVTPAANRGFDPHYDVHDVFVLQIAGQKRWRIHAPVHERPLADQPWTDHRAAVKARAEEEPVIDAVLTPGDVLYLPRGWLHSAEALGETTIHLTIGVTATTRYDVLRHLVDLAADTPQLRSALPLGVDPTRPDQLTTELDAIVRAVSDRLAQATVADVSEAVQKRLDSTTRPEPLALLAQVDAMNGLDPDSRVRLRRHTQIRVRAGRPDEGPALRGPGWTVYVDEDASGQLVVDSNVGGVRLDTSHLAAILALLDGVEHRVGDLPSDDRDPLSTVYLLMDAGLLVPAGDT